MERLTRKERNHDGTASSKQSLVSWFFPSDYCSKIVTKLADYEDLEENNLLIKLPVPLGTTVYGEEDGCIVQFSFDTDMVNAFGKYVFLTQEEAERKLAGEE